MTKASMTLSSASSDAAVASALSSVQITARQRRRVQAWRRSRERRGIILIFVVVLLMLLAIMGTAYLASSRADRLALSGTGALPGSNGAPLLNDRTRIDALFEASQKRVQYAIIEDLFNVAPGTMPGLVTNASRSNSSSIVNAKLLTAFRQEQQPAITGVDNNVYYHNYDAPGRADAYLASLLPVKADSRYASANSLIWPWISAPLRGELMPGVSTAPFFANPQNLDPSTTSNNATNQGFNFGPYAVQIDPTTTAAQNYKAPPAAWDKQVTDRNNVMIKSVELDRSATAKVNLESANTNRVYPALVVPTATGTRTVIAGDADGDGIADCGLMPVILNNNATNYVDRYVDAANGVVYFVGYRVVDNSAQININTALTAKGDFATLKTAVPSTANASDTTLLRNQLAQISGTTPDSPNLGFFRSNVGLTELVNNTLEMYPSPGAGQPTPMVQEMDRLIDARFPQVSKTNTLETPPSGTEYALSRMGFDTDPNAPTVSTQVVARYSLGPRNDTTLVTLPATPQDWYYRFRSFGDLLEQQLARQTDSPGKLRSGPNTLASGGLVSLPVADTVSFANASGALLNGLTTPSDGENALLLSTHMSAPNFTASNNQPWKWFPPADPYTWFYWTKDFGEQLPASDMTFATKPTGTDFQIKLLDDAPANRQFVFDPSSTPDAGLSGLVKTSLPMSIRGLLTTRSGTTNVTPKRFEALTSVPGGMPDYAPFAEGDEPNPTYPTYPAQKVSAATGTKEQLWRAYWSVMTQNTILQNTASNGYAAEKDLYDGRPYSSIPITNTSRATHYFQYTTTTTDPDDGYHHAYDAFMPPDRHPDLPAATGLGTAQTAPQTRLSDKQMTLIRSAVAACNTIDLRDNDNDITALTVDLGDSYTRPLGSTLPPSHNEMYARVYGTEKQLVITGVVMDLATTAGVPYIAVELYNPSNETLRLDGYYIGVVDRSTNTASAGAAGTTTLDNGKLKIDSAYSYAQSNLLLSSGGTVNTIAPGGFVILCNGSLSSAPASIQIQAKNDAVPLAAARPKVPPLAADEKDASSAPPQVIWCQNLTLLNSLQMPDRELALFRTRRADGKATAENPAVETNATKYHRPRFDEVLPASMVANDLLKLVPIDAVDFRSLAASGTSGGTGAAVIANDQYWYLRNTTPPNYFTPDKYAWREFYAGKFYDTRPGRTPETFVPGGGTTGINNTGKGTGPGQIPPKVPGGALASADDTAMPADDTSSPAALVTTTPMPDPYTKPSPTAGNDMGSWAWRDIPGASLGTSPVAALGTYREPPNGVRVGTTVGNPVPGKEAVGAIIPFPFFAPTIPIQNATPYSVFDLSQLQDSTTYPTPTIPAYNTTSYTGVPAPLVDHPPFQFPYGSPFARNGDVLNVPFIGSYSIFRVAVMDTPGPTSTVRSFPTASGGKPPLADCYEYVPLPMDAVNVAPFSTQWRRVNGGIADDQVENPSVGRFDPRLTILPRNDWSADLFDYVCARDADGSKVHFPDVPAVKADGTHLFNDAMVPSTDQDGPIVGYQAGGVYTGPTVVNDRRDTPWTEWRKDVVSPPAASGSLSRTPNTTSSGSSDTGSQLIQGTINLNTAPPVVLRMLPWTVDPTTGYLDQSPASQFNLEQRWRVGVVDDFLTNPIATSLTAPFTVSTGRLHALRNDPPYGFASLFQLSDLHRLKMVDPTVATPPRTPATVVMDSWALDVSDPSPAIKGTLAQDVQLMRLGMLNPMFRSASTSDFGIQHLNADRVSNLASQRSDVFTVYVTVQAWSYVANAPGTGTATQKQSSGTRLVGERRGSFVVDRSRISGDSYKLSDLIIYPVEQE